MRALCFDVFTLDLSRRVLLRAGNEVVLRPQVFDVLQYLVEHRGRVVSKKELFDAVWAGAARTDDSVVQCIVGIREALGDAEHRIIKTVPRRGYLFTSEIAKDAQQLSAVAARPVLAPASPLLRSGSHARPAHLEPDAASGQWKRILIAASLLMTVVVAGGWLLWDRTRPRLPVVLTMMSVPSIAILPFRTVGEYDKGDAAGALTDDVTTELSRTPRGYSMRIRSAPGYKVPADHPRGAGRELGVRYLVLGSVRREGDVRHVNVQLIEAEGSGPVWAEPFTYAPDDPGAQSRVAARIARMLFAQVLRIESRLPLPAHPEAGHFVILGRSLMTGGVEANRQAKAYFDQARAHDPNSMPALLGYGRTRVNEVLNRWMPKEQWAGLLDEAGTAVKHTESVDSRDAGLHVLRGAYLRARGRDAEAIAAFERALDLHRTYPLAHAELGRAKIEVGKASETVMHIEEAIRLSPTDTYIAAWYYWAGMAEAHVERYESAVKWLHKTREANPAYPNTVPWLAIAYGGLGGSDDEARTYLAEHRAIWPKWTISSWRLALPTRHPTAAEQRARIEAILCRLGAPGCEVATGATR